MFWIGNEELQADKEGDMMVDLVDDEVVPYKAAMCDHPDGGCDTFFYSKHHSCSPNIPHNKVCILFTCLFNFKLFFSTMFVYFRSFPSMDHFEDRYSFVNKNW
jgi:hypothetical protein